MNNSKTKRAVVVSLIKYEGELRLSLDDVELFDEKPAIWKQADHFTSKPVTDTEFDDLNFDEKELADFGYHVLARLHAFKQRGEA